MFERLLARDLRELLVRSVAERPAGCGENDPADICSKCGSGLSAATRRRTKAPPTFQALKDRVVLAVDGQNLNAAFLCRACHCFTGHDKNLLARDCQIFA